MPNVHIITVVGARPQFVKAAAVSRAMSPDRPSDLYGDGHSASRIVALLAGNAEGESDT